MCLCFFYREYSVVGSIRNLGVVFYVGVFIGFLLIGGWLFSVLRGLGSEDVEFL